MCAAVLHRGRRTSTRVRRPPQDAYFPVTIPHHAKQSKSRRQAAVKRAVKRPRQEVTPSTVKVQRTKRRVQQRPSESCAPVASSASEKMDGKVLDRAHSAAKLHHRDRDCRDQPQGHPCRKHRETERPPGNIDAQLRPSESRPGAPVAGSTRKEMHGKVLDKTHTAVKLHHRGIDSNDQSQGNPCRTFRETKRPPGSIGDQQRPPDSREPEASSTRKKMHDKVLDRAHTAVKLHHRGHGCDDLPQGHPCRKLKEKHWLRTPGIDYPRRTNGTINCQYPHETEAETEAVEALLEIASGIRQRAESASSADSAVAAGGAAAGPLVYSSTSLHRQDVRPVQPDSPAPRVQSVDFAEALGIHDSPWPFSARSRLLQQTELESPDAAARVRAVSSPGAVSAFQPSTMHPKPMVAQVSDRVINISLVASEAPRGDHMTPCSQGRTAGVEDVATQQSDTKTAFRRLRPGDDTHYVRTTLDCRRETPRGRTAIDGAEYSPTWLATERGSETLESDSPGSPMTLNVTLPVADDSLTRVSFHRFTKYRTQGD